MIIRLLIILIVLGNMFSCSQQSGNSESENVDKSDPVIVSPSSIQQVDPNPQVAAPEVILGSELSDTFSILSPRHFVNVKSFIAQWTEPKGLVNFDVMLSLTDKCNVATVLAKADHTDLMIEISDLSEGEYYLCIQAILEDRLLWAENSPYKITVDLTPPEAFEISAMTETFDTNLPMISWSESVGADEYDLIISRDSDCKTIVQKITNIKELTYTFTEEITDGRYYACMSANDNAQNYVQATNNGLLFVVDGTPSAITAINATSGFYKAGDNIYIDILFNQNVSVDTASGDALLKLDLGSTDVYAVYDSMKDASTLTFRYTVMEGDATTDLAFYPIKPQIIYGMRVLRNNSSKVFNEYGNSLDINLLSDNFDIYIDTVNPTTATNLYSSNILSHTSGDIYDNDGQIFFKWTNGSDDQSGLGKLKLHVFNNIDCGGVATEIDGIDSSLTSYNYTASTGATYSFKVETFDKSLNSVVSGCSVNNLLVDTVNPPLGANLKITDSDIDTTHINFDNDLDIEFKWDTIIDEYSGLDSYTLLRYDQSGCGGTVVNTTNINTAATSQSFTGVNGVTYSFKITGIDKAGNSSTSLCSSDTMVDIIDPVAVSNLITPADSAGGVDASYDNDTTIYFSWTAGSDADSGVASYTLHRFDQGSCGGTSTDTTGLSNATTSQSFVGVSGTTYSFKVTIIDNAGNLTDSACSTDIMIDTTAPVAASSLITPADSAGGVDANYDDDTTIYFAWASGSDADSGVASYTLQRFDQGSCGGTATATTGLSNVTTSHSFVGIDGTTYSFKVIVIDNAGNSAFSSCSTDMLIDTTAPVAASNLITPADSAGGADASYDDDTTIYFAWTAATDASAGIDTYTLHRYDLANCGGSSTDTTGLSSATLNQSFLGTHGNTYSFKVTAFDRAGNSTQSACSSNIMIDTTAPVAASSLITPADSAGGVDASYDDDTTIYFAWTTGSDADSGVASYTLHRFDQASCGGTSTDTTGLSNVTASQSFVGIDGTTYSFKVTIIDNAGNSTLSACSTDMMIDTTAPLAASSLITPADNVGGVDASYDDDTTIYFSWTAATDASSGIDTYTLHRYDLANCGGTSTDTTGLSSATLNQLFVGTHGNTYSFKVTAFDKLGNSTLSACSSNIMIDMTAPVAASSLITPADSAGGVDASYDNDTTIYFSWTAGSDADSGVASYTLHRFDQGSCGGISTDTTGLSNVTASQSFVGVHGTTYSFKVTIIDNAGNSTLSACSTDIMIDTTAPVAASSLITPADSAGGVDASYDDDTTIYFAWATGSDVDSGVLSYTLHRFDQASCGGTSTDTTGLSNVTVSQSFVGIDGTTYSFKVTIIDNAGNSTLSACSTDMMIDTTAPVAASSLITPADSAGGVDASYDNDTTIYFAWTAATDASSGIDTYTLHRYDLANCSGTSTDTTGLSSATLNQSFVGANGNTYSFKITAFDKAGNSTLSACSSNIMVDTTAPVAASSLITPADSAGGVDASYDNDTTIYFAWTAATDASSGIDTYTIHRYDLANCGGLSTDTTGLSNATVSQSFIGIDGVTYSFKITAIDKVGNSTLSNCSTNITIDMTPPAAFAITSPLTTAYTSTPTITWNTSSGAVEWDVYVDDESSCNSPWVQSFVGLGTNSQVLSTIGDGVYYLCVVARDIASNEILATNNAASFEIETTILHISYTTYDTVNYSLKYSFKSSGSWNTDIIENQSNIIDSSSSIALDSNEKAHLSYAISDGANLDVKYRERTIGSWSAASVLSSFIGDNYSSGTSLALNALDKVFVTYSGLDGSSNALLNEINNTSGSFASENNISSLTPSDTFVDTVVVLDNQAANIAHLMETNKVSGAYELRYRTNDTTWGTGINETLNNLPVNCGEQLFASIAIDSSHNPHIAYICADTPSGNCNIFYATKVGLNWTHTQIGTLQTACNFAALSNKDRPAIVLDSNDNAYIVYLDKVLDNLNYDTNKSGSWAGPTSIVNNSTVNGDLALAVDSFDKVYVIYENLSNELNVINNNSGTWSNENTGISNIYGIGDAAISGVKGRSNH